MSSFVRGPLLPLSEAPDLKSARPHQQRPLLRRRTSGLPGRALKGLDGRVNCALKQAAPRAFRKMFCRQEVSGEPSSVRGIPFPPSPSAIKNELVPIKYSAQSDI
ncbi:MAG: hypothetical protein CMG93_17745 [Marinomonas sp.]|nr:hypothetical protein [Marinomonas sp.]